MSKLMFWVPIFQELGCVCLSLSFLFPRPPHQIALAFLQLVIHGFRTLKRCKQGASGCGRVWSLQSGFAVEYVFEMCGWSPPITDLKQWLTGCTRRGAGLKKWG